MPENVLSPAGERNIEDLTHERGEIPQRFDTQCGGGECDISHKGDCKPARVDDQSGGGR